MVDSRITGATIACLRRTQNWTQLELAERLHVTPQAVSRWETGDSFPDIGQLARLSDIFKVSIDALLKDDFSPESTSSGRVTTGEVLVDLSQDRAEQVARQILDDQADLESVIEAAPLIRPSIIG
jgi:transcriptional regulator with XRE-family HTH domain